MHGHGFFLRASGYMNDDVCFYLKWELYNISSPYSFLL